MARSPCRTRFLLRAAYIARQTVERAKQLCCRWHAGTAGGNAADMPHLVCASGCLYCPTVAMVGVPHLVCAVGCLLYPTFGRACRAALLPHRAKRYSIAVGIVNTKPSQHHNPTSANCSCCLGVSLCPQELAQERGFGFNADFSARKTLLSGWRAWK